MFRHLVCAFGLVIFGLFILGCSTPTPPPPTPPSVTIDSPNIGAIFLVGEQVIVQSTLSDAAGITRVSLSVDGTVVAQDSPDSLTGPFQMSQSWTAAKPGGHTLVVKATNVGGSLGVASLQITVQQADTSLTPRPIASIAPIISATPLVVPAAVDTAIPTNPPEGSTPEPSAAGCIDDARFIADLSIPDGTNFSQNATFEKSWELENNGTCVWQDYAIEFIGGTQMAPQSFYTMPLTQPGERADITIPMTAPAAFGTHKGTWQLQNTAGNLFGTAVTVVIIVPGPAAPTATAVANRTVTPPLTVLLPTNTPTSQACKGNPSELTFTASPSSIAAGAEVVLSWGAVTNATYVTLDGGIYAQEGVTTPGTVTVTPGETTEYTLQAVCENGGAVRTKRLTVIVNGVQPKTATPTDLPPGTCAGTPGIGSFDVNKDTVDAGEKVTLTWSGVTNADDIKLFSGSDVDTVNKSGQVKRTVNETTTFRLQALCNASGTSNEEQITVTVNP